MIHGAKVGSTFAKKPVFDPPKPPVVLVNRRTEKKSCLKKKTFFFAIKSFCFFAFFHVFSKIFPRLQIVIVIVFSTFFIIFYKLSYFSTFTIYKRENIFEKTWKKAKKQKDLIAKKGFFCLGICFLVLLFTNTKVFFWGAIPGFFAKVEATFAPWIICKNITFFTRNACTNACIFNFSYWFKFWTTKVLKVF